MNVAVCISGAMRGDLDSTLVTIQKNIVKPLGADVFIRTWNHYYAWPGCGGAAAISYRLFGIYGRQSLPRPIDYNAIFKKIFPRTYNLLEKQIINPLNINDIASRIQYKSLYIEDEDFFEHYVSELFSISPINTHLINQIKMFYGIYACNKIMQLYSYTHNKKYDYVIFVRPDIGIDTCMTENFLLNIPDKHIAVDFGDYGPNDQFFSAEFSTMNILCSIWKESLKNNKLSYFKNFPNKEAHQLLFLHMANNSIYPYITNGKIKRLLYSATYKVFPDLWLELAEDFRHEAAPYANDTCVRDFFNLIHQNKYAKN